MNVVLACGGSGGHLFPGLAVAEALLARGHRVCLLVSEKPIDQTALASWSGSATAPANLSARQIPAIGCEGRRRLVRFCVRLLRAARDCLAVCEQFRADAVLGMGGFTTAAAVWAARRCRRQSAVLVHESNALPGRANRWAAARADHVAVGWPECARFFGRSPVTVTGTPVRARLRGGRRADAHERLGLRADRATVLVMGGSQGAHAINEAVACALPWLAERREQLQFVHLTGAQDEAFVRDCYEKNGIEATVMSFCDRMELAYSVADLAVARAGAATLAELAAFGVPAILVPYPQAAGNHQWHNARLFERAGAARVLEQQQLNGLHAARGERMAEALCALLDEEAARRRMSAAARALAVEDSAERIVTLLEQHAR